MKNIINTKLFQSARTISTTGSCSEGTVTVTGIGRHAVQHWALIGWPALTWPGSVV